MKTEIAIKSKLFPSYEDEELNINPGRFGKRLAEAIKVELETHSIVVSDLYSTDCAYELRIEQFEFKVFVVVGNMDGEDDEFLISIEPNKEYIRKWFKKISTKEVVSRVYNVILSLCDNNPGIQILNDYD